MDLSPVTAAPRTERQTPPSVKTRRVFFTSMATCADELRTQLQDAATQRSLRHTISRFVRSTRGLSIPAERVIAAFTFMLSGVLDEHAAPEIREEVRLELMRIAIEELSGAPCADRAIR